MDNCQDCVFGNTVSGIICTTCLDGAVQTQVLSVNVSGGGSTEYTCDAVCGNGNILIPEECDDNNTIDGDGCSSTCTI